jgi:hypothetical protein
MIIEKQAMEQEVVTDAKYLAKDISLTGHASIKCKGRESSPDMLCRDSEWPGCRRLCVYHKNIFSEP